MDFGSLIQDVVGLLLNIAGEIGGSEEAIETVSEVDGDLSTANELAGEAYALTEPATPVLRDAAEIPAEPLPALGPVADAVGVIDTALRSTVRPILSVVVGILSGVVGLLAPILAVLQRRNQANSGLHASLLDASSVAQQIHARYGDKTPEEVAKQQEALAKALKAIQAERRAFDSIVADIEGALEPFDPVKDISGYLTPVMDKLRPVEQTLNRFLSDAAGLLGKLKRAQRAYNKWKDCAIAQIEDGLKKAGINPSFIKTIQNDIAGAQKLVVHELTAPLTTLRNEVQEKLKDLDAPIEKLQGLVNQLDRKVGSLFDPLSPLLKSYIAAAAKIGIKPA